MTDWHAWHDQYADPASSLSRRLVTVQRLLADIVAGLGSEHRVLSLCAGDGRDVIPVLAARPVDARPSLVLVELDPGLAAAARERAAAAGVRADVVTGDAGAVATWREWLPVDLLMLCGIFGNISDDDIRATIGAARSMVAPGGAVIWTRGAFRDDDLREQIRAWFVDGGFAEIAYESEPAGYGVGVNRATEPSPAEDLPARLFTFTR